MKHLKVYIVTLEETPRNKIGTVVYEDEFQVVDKVNKDDGK